MDVHVLLNSINELGGKVIIYEACQYCFRKTKRICETQLIVTVQEKVTRSKKVAMFRL